MRGRMQKIEAYPYFATNIRLKYVCVQFVRVANQRSKLRRKCVSFGLAPFVIDRSVPAVNQNPAYS